MYNYISKTKTKTNMTSQIQSSLLELASLITNAISEVTSIDFEQENSQWRINIITPNQTPYIESNFALLKAIQHVARVSIHKQYPQDKTHFVFDVNKVGQKRENLISVRIPELAQQTVIKQGKTIILVNLTNFERLQVHHILADVNGLETTSVGEEDNRKLLIIPTSDVGTSNFDDAIIFDINNPK
jgi:spoIIIJ-associated protein